MVIAKLIFNEIKYKRAFLSPKQGKSHKIILQCIHLIKSKMNSILKNKVIKLRKIDLNPLH